MTDLEQNETWKLVTFPLGNNVEYK